MKKTARSISIFPQFVFFLGFINLYCDAGKNTAFASDEALYPIDTQVQYSFTLKNKTNRLLKKAEFQAYAPVKQTSTQYVNTVNVSHPYELRVDELGNQILSFSFDDLPPYAARVITVRVSVLFSSSPNPVPNKGSHSFLASEKYIEFEDPALNEFAKGFPGPDVLKSEKEIYQWIVNNVKYAGYLKDARGALYAFNKRRGDCTEFMYLFTALSRATGVPARGVGGYVINKSEILNPSKYHNWAEFYDKGVWNTVDPQKRVFIKSGSHFLAMRIIGNLQGSASEQFDNLSYNKNDDFEVIMNSSDNLNKELKYVKSGSVFYYKEENKSACASCAKGKN